MTVTILVDHRFNGFFVFRKGEGVEYVSCSPSRPRRSPRSARDRVARPRLRMGRPQRLDEPRIAVGIGVGAAVLQVALFWRNPRKVAST